MSISELKIPFLADAMGSLGWRYGKIAVEDGLKLNLVHLTAVPPFDLKNEDRRLLTTEEALLVIEKFKKMIHDQPRLKLVMNQKDLASAIKEQKIAVVLGMQNTPIDILNNGISKLRESGIAIISPCYDGQNDLGSGWENSDIGLTRWGKIFIKECDENGVIVDLSHCGHKTARDIVAFSYGRKVKLMASHTGCFSKCHNFWNLPDNVLKIVAELEGFVGITTLTSANHETDNSPFPFKDHLARAISLCGENSVCIGSDDLYISRTVEEAQAQFKKMSPILDPDGTQGARFPENPLAIMGPDMLDKLYKFCHPYFPVGIPEKVFGQNLLHFFQRALPA